MSLALLAFQSATANSILASYGSNWLVTFSGIGFLCATVRRAIVCLSSTLLTLILLSLVLLLVNHWLNILQPEPHVLPSVFSCMQRRDERKRQYVRSKDSESVFNSNGFVETMDNPRDIYYKRDSIMHSKHKRAVVSTVYGKRWWA